MWALLVGAWMCSQWSYETEDKHKMKQHLKSHNLEGMAKTSSESGELYCAWSDTQEFEERAVMIYVRKELA